MRGIYYIEEVSTTYYFKETAFQNAINHIGASTLWDDVECGDNWLQKPTAELVLPSMADQGKSRSTKVNLAYKFDIYATSPVSRGIYIYAITGVYYIIMPPLSTLENTAMVIKLSEINK
jgi:hypothetical protein